MSRVFRIVTIIILFTSCRSAKHSNFAPFSRIAEKYVKLGLTIGQFDPDFVDAYYGPDSLQPAPQLKRSMPADSLLNAVNLLLKEVSQFTTSATNKASIERAKWMQGQLLAFSRRIKITSGKVGDFDEESQDLFGATAPRNSEGYFQDILKQLDSFLPGSGTTAAKAEALSKQFVIPKDKIDTVFKAAIAEARQRTAQHFTLPAGETFTMEYVTGKPWSGYNWYKGNFKSVIQINTDLPINIERAIDLACHEGYPGHHVYNVLLEKNLYRDKVWVEMSLYPLFSPQSIIAEGSANYGIEMAFPGEEKNRFAKRVLFPLAGLDTAKADAYFKMLELKSKLNYARNEAARGFLNGTFSEEEALRWLTGYSLFSPAAATKSLNFIKKYRSYVINYNYGQDMIRNYIENNGGGSGSEDKRWQLFGWLLSNAVTPNDLLANKNGR